MDDDTKIEEKDQESQILVVTLRMRKEVVDLVDKERSRFSAPRSAWITQAVVEKLEKLGYSIE